MSKVARSMVFPLTTVGYFIKYKKTFCNEYFNSSDCYNRDQLHKLKEVDRNTHSTPTLAELIEWNDVSLVGRKLLEAGSINIGFQNEFEFYRRKIDYQNHLDVLKLHSKYLSISKNLPQDYVHYEYHDGACQAMCIYVVEQYFKGKKIPDILSIFGRGYPNYFKEVNDKSTLFTGYYSKSNLVPHNEALLTHGFNITENGYTDRFKDEKYFMSLITALPCGAYFCIGHSVFGLHAIVFIVEMDQKFILFDPNFGALHFTKQELKQSFYGVISKVFKREDNLDVQIFRLEKL